MARLPQFYDTDKNFQMMQTSWSAILNPVITNDLVQGQLLQNVTLITGNNVVNHKLGRKLVGWYITRMRSNYAEIYDTQDSNTMPNLTLQLNANTGVNVDLWVF